MKVTINKISKNENTFKTKLPLTGELYTEPRIGYSIMVENPKTPGKGIVTSTIMNVYKSDTGWIIDTRNSTYRIDKVKDN